MASFGVEMHVNTTKQCLHSSPAPSLASRQISGRRASTSSRSQFAGQRVAFRARQCTKARQQSAMVVRAVKDGAVLDRPLRVAVIGGGPSGACTAETLAKSGIETFLLERKMDNCKVKLLLQTECCLKQHLLPPLCLASPQCVMSIISYIFAAVWRSNPLVYD